MSVRQMGVVWKLYKCVELEQKHMLLLCCLAEHANDEGYCYPSVKTIAKETQMDISTVKRSISSLRKDHVDLLEIQSGGGRFSNHYRLTFPQSLIDEWDREHPHYKREQPQILNGKVRKNYSRQFSNQEIITMEGEITSLSSLNKIKDAVNGALEKVEKPLPPGVYKI